MNLQQFIKTSTDTGPEELPRPRLAHVLFTRAYILDSNRWPFRAVRPPLDLDWFPTRK